MFGQKDGASNENIKLNREHNSLVTDASTSTSGAAASFRIKKRPRDEESTGSAQAIGQGMWQSSAKRRRTIDTHPEEVDIQTILKQDFARNSTGLHIYKSSDVCATSFLDAIAVVLNEQRKPDKQISGDYIDQAIDKFCEKIVKPANNFENDWEYSGHLLCRMLKNKSIHMITQSLTFDVGTKRDIAQCTHTLITAEDVKKIDLNEVNFEDPKVIHITNEGDKFFPLMKSKAEQAEQCVPGLGF